jgi:hypothetical protein
MHPISVELGEVEVNEAPDKSAVQQLNDNLKLLGFEIIDDRKSRIIEQIKTAIVNLVHYSEEQTNLNLSDYLSAQLNYDYGYLSNLFLGS